VFINDVGAEYSRYIEKLDDQTRKLEDGTMSRQPQSLICLPLVNQDRVLGVITIQSFEKNAYSGHHLTMLQNLAAFTSIALDNAGAYRQLNEQEHEIRRLFDEAQRARTLAEEADAAKSAFLSTVSHELRTPLTSIHASLRLMQQGMGGALAPEARHLVDVAARNSQRLVRLVDEILDLRKIEAGLALERQPVDLRPLLEQALEANRSYAEQCGVRFVLQGEAGPAMVLGDAERLMQVLANLLSNAAKYSPAGEAIVVAAERCEDAIRVSVRDRGPGIPPEFRSRIFQKFAQADTSTSREKGGTGLGLSISKAIVERLGGRIDFDSDPGRATTFYFELPEHRPE
jgi:signal transduction histidine kinase